MFTLHPDTSGLLHILVQSAGAKNLVEIGVAYGYSTIWLAHVSQLTGGRLSSLEINPKLIEIAKQNVEEAGLSGQVDFVLGDARETVNSIAVPFDFVLLDCWEWLYVEMLDVLAPRPLGAPLLASRAAHWVFPDATPAPCAHRRAESQAHCRPRPTPGLHEALRVPLFVAGEGHCHRPQETAREQT